AQADRTQRLAGLDRLLQQLNPEAPLARGYALVSAPGHRAISSRDVAAGEPVLTLKFADGTLDVVTGVVKKPKPRPSAAKDSPPGQPKLL
ncbi:exodeoxyribonuclease VII large subunit, partial [Aurantiacibacter xanthus]